MRKAALAFAFTAALAFTGAAAAQSPSTSGSPSAGAPGPQSTGSTGNQTTGSAGANGAHGTRPVTIAQLKQSLQQAGLTDVTVLEDAFVVRAKTQDGHPVVMTIGPNGVNAVEMLSGPSPTGQNGTGAASTSPSGSGQSGNR
jgi:hypothetical protein